MRTESEIVDEVQRLRDLLPKIWEGCDYATVNRASIHAEIAVLEKRMTKRDVEATFGNDESPEYQAYIFDSALGSFSWMTGKSNDRSSDDWASLLG